MLHVETERVGGLIITEVGVGGAGVLQCHCTEVIWTSGLRWR